MATMKITYMISPKVNFYLDAQLKFPDLKAGIEQYLFVDYKLEKCDTRLYWIDHAGDEIGMFNQRDLDIFKSQYNTNNYHMFVKPEKGPTPNENNAANAGANVSAQAVHTNVECDGCNATPIIGFRYKCVQCPNFDLCSGCESMQKHAEHMMVRMPNTSCPTVVQTWLSGNGGIKPGRHGCMGGRRGYMRGVPASGPAGVFCKNSEPMGENNGGAAEGKTDDKSHGRGRHGHKHHRRHERNGFLSNLYEMMTDLAEGGPAEQSSEGNAEAAAAAAAAEIAAATAAVSTKAAEAAAAAASTIAAELAAAVATVSANVEQQPATPTTAGNIKSTTFTTTTSKVDTAENVQPTTTTATAAATQTTANEINAEQPNTSTRAENNSGSGNATTPVLDINNIMQFIDPQYMKTGIQILNNFSEMFAKMLDPIDGAASLNESAAGSPANSSNNSTRKSSVSSNTGCATPNTTTNVANGSATGANDTTLASNMSSAASSTPNSTTKTTNNDTAVSCNNTTTASTTAATVNTSADWTTDVSAAAATTVADESHLLDSRARSLSEENDWQMIDKQLVGVNESFDDISGASSSASNGSIVQTLGAPKAEINFEKLSNDLQAHIRQETQAQQQNQAAANLIDLNAVTLTDLPEDDVENRNTPATNANVPVAAATQDFIQAETRAVPVFHKEPRINSAILAMMAMGFSNEGGWLTQLLETVNGNISQALDLINETHQNRQ